jgi:hypothetical protein
MKLQNGKGTEFLRSGRDWNVPVWALLRRKYRRIRPEAASVAVNVRTY